MSSETKEVQMLDDLEVALERAIETCWSTCSMLEDYGENRPREELVSKLREFSENLNDVHDAGIECYVPVHRNVIVKADTGINPDLFTQEYATIGKTHHEALRTKMFSAKILRDQLQARVDQWEAESEKKSSTTTK